MRNMLKTIQTRLEQGEALVLVTVIASSGATPRGAGARMLIGSQGRICGTIGGGAVEYRSEQIAARVLEEKTSMGHDFTLTKDDVQNLGMICGGACDVFFHYLPAGDAHTISLCEEAEAQFRKGSNLWLLTELGEKGRMGLYSEASGFWGIPVSEELKLSRHPERLGSIFAEQINVSGRVYIFGGGHVAQELVPVLSHVGFRCVVMDDREEFTRKELFPGAEEVICGDLQNIGEYMTIGNEDYVCVMTRGHAYDTVIQAQVLRCRPTYCGVIGSPFKAAGVRKTLKEEYGLSDDELDLVTTPIGLPIKGETPAEIAISIAAQMILHRAERNGL
ncbi:MAG: XdhC family protein [Oscillospiraceae bacterium]|nr:XdhC family protein [Oscillospiraceae bacterium]